MIGDDYDYRAKCEKLERENAELNTALEGYRKAWAAQNDYIRTLWEALKPFAEAADATEGYENDEENFQHGLVTPGDYRRARAALSARPDADS